MLLPLHPPWTEAVVAVIIVVRSSLYATFSGCKTVGPYLPQGPCPFMVCQVLDLNDSDHFTANNFVITIFNVSLCHAFPVSCNPWLSCVYYMQTAYNGTSATQSGRKSLCLGHRHFYMFHTCSEHSRLSM